MPVQPELGATVTGLYVGQVSLLWPGKPASAIGKLLTEAPQALTETGFTDDQQADLVVHGGVEKAVITMPRSTMKHGGRNWAPLRMVSDPAGLARTSRQPE